MSLDDPQQNLLPEVWRCKLPIKLVLANSDITISAVVKPVYLLASRCNFLHTLATQAFPFFQHVLPKVPGILNQHALFCKASAFTQNWDAFSMRPHVETLGLLGTRSRLQLSRRTTMKHHCLSVVCQFVALVTHGSVSWLCCDGNAPPSSATATSAGK